MKYNNNNKGDKAKNTKSAFYDPSFTLMTPNISKSSKSNNKQVKTLKAITNKLKAKKDKSLTHKGQGHAVNLSGFFRISAYGFLSPPNTIYDSKCNR